MSELRPSDIVQSWVRFETAEEINAFIKEQLPEEQNMVMGMSDEQPERKRGKWIEANTHTYGIYECTACKAWTYIPNEPRDYNFCPRCGADMREVDDERPD